MANETSLTIIGTLTAGPKLRHTPSGVAVANFRSLPTLGYSTSPPGNGAMTRCSFAASCGVTPRRTPQNASPEVPE